MKRINMEKVREYIKRLMENDSTEKKVERMLLDLEQCPESFFVPGWNSWDEIGQKERTKRFSALRAEILKY